MTPGQITTAQETHRLSTKKLDLITRIEEATPLRWKTGSPIQNRRDDLHLRLLREPGNMALLRAMEAARNARRR